MRKNEDINNPKKYSSEMIQKIEIINDVKYKNFINSKKKKIQEEIKDVIIDKYLTKIISQQKEIEQLKNKLEETIKSSLIILKNSLDKKSNINSFNNTLSPKAQKHHLKNEILNINNKNDIIVHILNRNKNYKNINYSTISSDNIKLMKSNTQLTGLTVEYKKKSSKEKNNLSLSSSRIKFNKYEIITPKRIKIEKINKPASKSKSKSKNKKEESSRHTINKIDINELNTYYLKEYNKKDNQRIEEIKTKLLNNNLPPPEYIKNVSTPNPQKNITNSGNNVFKSYTQNKFKKIKKQNLANKSNNYSYGKSNLQKIFNSPKNIKTQFNIIEKNKCFNEYYINKNKMTKNKNEENKNLLDNNYIYASPTYNTKNIIHRNININNNNNKIYINTDNNINNVYLHNMNNIKGINKHFKTQTNFYQHKVINRGGDNQIGINFKEIMMTSPTEYN